MKEDHKGKYVYRTGNMLLGTPTSPFEGEFKDGKYFGKDGVEILFSHYDVIAETKNEILDKTIRNTIGVLACELYDEGEKNPFQEEFGNKMKEIRAEFIKYLVEKYK